MADAAPTVNLKMKALELANSHVGEAHDVVVKRAAAYHAFLSGSAAVATGAASTKPTGATGAAGAAAGAGTPGATSGGTAPKTAATQAQTDAAKKAAAEAAKKKAAAEAAAKKAAAAAPGPAGDGPVLEDVSKAIQGVLGLYPDRELGKKDAYAIMEKVAGVRAVKDLKPALYQQIVDACTARVAEVKAAAAKKPAPAPADEAVDDFGDPPEETGAGVNAETGEDM